MQLKLRKIGNSWGVIFPKDVVKPFLEHGVIYLEIEAEMPETTGVTNVEKKSEPSATEEEVTLVTEEEVPEEYVLKPEYRKK